MEQQTDALLVKAMDKSMCQGVGNGLKTSLTKRNSQVNHVRWYRKTDRVIRLNKSCQVISVCKWSKNRNNNNDNNNMHQSPEPSAQPSSSSCEEPMQVSTTPRRARKPDDERERNENSSSTVGHECSDQ